jgi:hypothetical protein
MRRYISIFSTDRNTSEMLQITGRVVEEEKEEEEEEEEESEEEWDGNYFFVPESCSEMKTVH